MDIDNNNNKSNNLAERAIVGRRQLSFIADLNLKQREAVETINGPLLVLAGAGTGKTRALTARIAYLIDCGYAKPNQILAVTFTNKAAQEMRQRIEKYLGSTVEGMPWIGTFHSIGAKILRRHAELIKLKSNFTILDTDDQLRLLKQLISLEKIDEKRWPARNFLGLLDHWKNNAWTPDRLPQDEINKFDGKGQKIYKLYQERLSILNSVDFGDLILFPILLMQLNSDLLDQYHKIFKYILVDEYQDTNVSQYKLLKLLTGKYQNICCVGDDDQSIYSWRGAEISNILRFEKDFPEAKTIRLEENYRSTGHILTAASKLIENNESRLGKTLWTNSGEGEKITVKSNWDGEEEARQITSELEKLSLKNYNLDETAILVRASFQMREFEERFITVGLPYRVIGGPRFYERQEIRDAIAYMRVVVQPDDSLAFERIVNVPRRGIGVATMQAIHHLSRLQSVSVPEAARRLVNTDELRPQARRAITKLLSEFDRWSGLVETTTHVELVKLILDESGYTRMWQQDKAPEAPGRLENLSELVSALEEFENLSGFLEHVSLVMEAGNSDNEEMVSIMTLHAAKGLEFDTVFLPGWEEGLFPNQRAIDEGGEKALEEERRLAYVGLTRARVKANISFAANRRIYNQWQTSIPSRFVDELPEDQVDLLTDVNLYGNSISTNDIEDEVVKWIEVGRGPGFERIKGSRRQHVDTRMIDGTAVAIEDVKSPDAVNKGTRVFHQKFGYGMVLSVDGDKLDIDFEKAGRKKVMAGFVEAV